MIWMWTIIRIKMSNASLKRVLLCSFTRFPSMNMKPKDWLIAGNLIGHWKPSYICFYQYAILYLIKENHTFYTSILHRTFDTTICIWMMSFHLSTSIYYMKVSMEGYFYSFPLFFDKSASMPFHYLPDTFPYWHENSLAFLLYREQIPFLNIVKFLHSYLSDL